MSCGLDRGGISLGIIAGGRTVAGRGAEVLAETLHFILSKWEGREEERALKCLQVPSGCVWGAGCGGRGGSRETRGHW